MTRNKQSQASQIVRRAIRLSRRYHEAGNIVACKRCWNLASRVAYHCGGISGCSWAGGGYSGIVLEDGLIAISPVPMYSKGV